jgi:transcriptional regulator with XRE-family HTH domain
MRWSRRSIKALRKAREWTQAELAAALGVDTATVSRWERGLSLPRSKPAARLTELQSQAARPATHRFGDDPSLNELVRFLGVDETRRLLRRAVLLHRATRPVRFLVDPASRIREADVALTEQRQLKAHAKLG